MYITEVSIKRPVVAWVMSLILIIFGVFVFSELPVRELPDGIQPPVVQVQTDYKSASAEIVDEEITQKLEDVIGGAEGIKNIDSSSLNGRSRINIQFNTDIDLDDAANDIRERVARVVDNLPSESNPPQILKQAADKVQRVTMELSGHSPFIVFDDADIKKAADMAIAAKFRNNGQVCISPNRFYIQESKKDEFVNLFVEKTKKLKIGDGMDPNVQLGPLTTKKRLNEVEELVETTKKEGAKVLLGGKRPAGFNKGYFYEPTVFDNVKDDFTIMKQEPFGPLVPMLSFKTFDEVIERANNNDLGLCSYIYTNSMEQAHKASELMETGCVAVNTAAVAVAEAPFGGIKQTGYGREGGSMAIKDYLNIKYTHLGLKN